MGQRSSNQPPPITRDSGSEVFRYQPLAPHEMTRTVTPADELFVLSHLGRFHMAREDWRLEVTGLVEQPLQLRLPDLARFQQVRVETVHQCAGSPLAPAVATRRIANVIWEGVRLSDILVEARPRTEATYVWSDGADAGTFEGQAVPFYRKDLPLERLHEDVLLATKLNGEDLADEHGAPARLVISGFYGTNSVKWIWRLTLADRRADGLFTTKYYNNRMPNGEVRPVWALKPESILVFPAPGARISGSLKVHGWAWADSTISVVEFSCNGGLDWTPAIVEARHERAWQAWHYMWSPNTPGTAVLICRATDVNGETQPLLNARNAVHRIEVLVGLAS